MSLSRVVLRLKSGECESQMSPPYSLTFRSNNKNEHQWAGNRGWVAGRAQNCPQGLHCPLAPWESPSVTTLNGFPMPEIIGLLFWAWLWELQALVPHLQEMSPVINPLSSNVVTPGTGAAAGMSPPVHYSSPDVFSRVVGKTQKA